MSISKKVLQASLITVLLASEGSAQKLAKPTRIWSVGPLTKGDLATGVSFGPGGATFSAPHVDSQTSSIFAATRSVVFAGDRVVLSSKIGTRKIDTAPVASDIVEVLSIDVRTGEVKDTREFAAFGLELFATSDGHVIVSGRTLLRLTPDLKDDGVFDSDNSGHKLGGVENGSPDGSTLGNATRPGFELINSRSLQSRSLTAEPAYDTSVSSKGFVTDNVHWTRDYPKDLSFVTYTDALGEHLLYHGECGGRPQFLNDNLLLEPGCKNPLLIDTDGKLVRTLPIKGAFSYAGVSQNGQRFALQVANFTGMHSLKSEHFAIYSVQSGEMIADISPDEPAEEQSWTAFSADGSMFVVGSPLKLTLYRLP